MKKPQFKGLEAIGLADVDWKRLAKWVVDWVGWLASIYFMLRMGFADWLVVLFAVIGLAQLLWPFLVSELRGIPERPVVKFGKREIKMLAEEIVLSGNLVVSPELTDEQVERILVAAGFAAGQKPDDFG